MQGPGHLSSTGFELEGVSGVCFFLYGYSNSRTHMDTFFEKLSEFVGEPDSNKGFAYQDLFNAVLKTWNTYVNDIGVTTSQIEKVKVAMGNLIMPNPKTNGIFRKNSIMTQTHNGASAILEVVKRLWKLEFMRNILVGVELSKEFSESKMNRILPDFNVLDFRKQFRENREKTSFKHEIDKMTDAEMAEFESDMFKEADGVELQPPPPNGQRYRGSRSKRRSSKKKKKKSRPRPSARRRSRRR